MTANAVITKKRNEGEKNQNRKSAAAAAPSERLA
jgi:hypothetical protein